MKDVIAELTRIVQQVSMVQDATRQVRLIVDQIAQTLECEVCSLYRIAPEGHMELLASHGLNAERPVTIPGGQGLVGLVARTRHVVNLANGLKHPDYFHVADLLEERFKSFCGVPLVNNGEVIGVLVVQGRYARKLSSKHEAFLSTLAAHIALLVQQLPVALDDVAQQKQMLGVPAAPGVAIGHALLCRRDSLANAAVSYNHDVALALEEWQSLLQRVDEDLKQERAALGAMVSAEVANMFDAYQMLLFDPTLSERVKAAIREGYALTTAIKMAIQHYADLFRAMDDEYMKARHEDVWHLGNKLYHTYQNRHPEIALEAAGHEAIILIGHDISVSDIAGVPTKRLKGIVSAGGSRLSHTAILANALGIPAVMGVPGILEVAEQELLIVDGFEGQVFSDPAETLLAEYQVLIERERSMEAGLEKLRELPAQTKDGQRIQLLSNSGLLSDISPGLKHGSEGIGLFRTEIPFMASETFPTEDEQIRLYRKALELYRGKPVVMRTLDVGGDKPLPYFSVGFEENPALGWRGIRFALDNVQLLVTQLRAMLKAAREPGQLHILVPMVAYIDELRTVRKLLDETLVQLKEEGVTVHRPRLGIMIEVPAAISQLPKWRPYLDFVSVGSNDLSQYLLALDRNNPRVAARYDHVHPAVVSELKRVVDLSQSLELPLSVCGEMAADPVSVLLLVGMGVERLSMSSARLPRIKLLIRNLDRATAQAFLQRALDLESAQAIRELGKQLIEENGLLTIR
ncbi:MAG: phosphoenolpyruvate--protein phosphotransferase [Oleiphilaceae bacterium]|nr:phosphoenolpyruvate--protein phosphotransferase [Oleiphilaceae bacterium]